MSWVGQEFLDTGNTAGGCTMSLPFIVRSRILAVVTGGVAMAAQLAALTLFSHLATATPGADVAFSEAHCGAEVAPYTLLLSKFEVSL